MLEDMLIRRDELIETLSDKDAKNLDRAKILEQIDKLNEALGESSYVEDGLIDEWERQLEAGETPDLEAEWPGT